MGQIFPFLKGLLESCFAQFGTQPVQVLFALLAVGGGIGVLDQAEMAVGRTIQASGGGQVLLRHGQCRQGFQWVGDVHPVLHLNHQL